MSPQHRLRRSPSRSLFVLPVLILGWMGGVLAQAQVINEFIVNHLGPDQYEFLEVAGTPSTDYSDLTILELWHERSRALPARLPPARVSIC